MGTVAVGANGRVLVAGGNGFLVRAVQVIGILIFMAFHTGIAVQQDAEVTARSYAKILPGSITLGVCLEIDVWVALDARVPLLAMH